MNTGGTPGGMPVLNRRPHGGAVFASAYASTVDEVDDDDALNA